MRFAVRAVLTAGLVLSAASLSPLAAADADTGTASAQASAKATVSVARAASRPKTTITSGPTNPSTYGKAVFTYSADKSGVRFRCKLTGPRQPNVWRRCQQETRSSSGGDTHGRAVYRKLFGSRHRWQLKVQSFRPKHGSTAEVTGTTVHYRWHQFTAHQLDHFRPNVGATFNNPLSTRSAGRVSLGRVIRTIDSMPGYQGAWPGLCPTAGKFVPGTIRITLYSLTDEAVAQALIRARHRCLSVQVLMNDHLDRNTDPAWRHLEDALGTEVGRGGNPMDSFAHRCHLSCRGIGVLHTKMYLFDSTMRDRRRNHITKTTMVGSTNMTSNASDVQWNDLYAVPRNANLWKTYWDRFNLMRKDNGVHRKLVVANDGRYQTIFWPQKKGGSDPEMGMLRSVRCTGANGGTGTHGRSIVYINMHAWFGTRGLALARQVRRMYGAGCHVHVLYSFMSYGVFKILRHGTGARMTVRRTLFSHDGHTAYVYSHFKNISVSGHVGGDRSAKIVWTGSNNFTNDGTHFDEVMMRIASSAAYAQYVRQFAYMSNRLSSPTYASFYEPGGGGRAPRAMAPGGGPGDRELPPPGTPVITSPDVHVDRFGQPHVTD